MWFQACLRESLNEATEASTGRTPGAGRIGEAQCFAWSRVEIRRATGNRKGLQDALRAIVAAGATINTDSALPPILHIGDQATGTTVLSDFLPALERYASECEFRNSLKFAAI